MYQAEYSNNNRFLQKIYFYAVDRFPSDCKHERVVESEDMSGLVLESGIFDVLLEHVRFDVPESLVLNHAKDGWPSADLTT